jgi:hypothetical protein
LRSIVPSFAGAKRGRKREVGMDIEKQRWEPVPAACVPVVDEAFFPGAAGAYRFTDAASGDAHPTWDGFVEEGLKQFVFDHESGPAGPPICGCYMAKSCTEYASYEDAWARGWGKTGADIVAKMKSAFDGKGARILDIDLSANFPDPPPSGGTAHMSVIFVPNYGPAARAWWWSGSAGATAAEVASVLNGKAWPAGKFKNDGIKKKLVAIERGSDHKFRFVMNKLKPGEAWWWGYGASLDNITAVLNGNAWADFKKDKIEKRLVSLKRHAPGNWTFIMVPRDGLGWVWHPHIDSIKDLQAEATKNNQRIIDLEFHDPTPTDLQVSAVLVQNI